jgi:GGDEF domain-containing protein
MQALGVSSLQDIGYARARRLILSIGLAVLAITAAVMYARRVDTAEVVGTLLYMGVFVGFVFWKVPGGIAAGVGAALAYAALRYPAIDAVGVARFGALLLSRALAYLTFGVIGGWATQQLEGSLAKLELYDQIDDSTGLYNARFFVEDTDLEMSRSTRYNTIFSVAVADIPAVSIDRLSRRQRASVLRSLGGLLQRSVRNVDRPVFATDRARHRIAVVLPETGAEGARVFAERLAARIAELLGQAGAVEHLALTYPGDDERLVELRREFEAIDRAEHPEAAELSSR